MSLGQRDSVTSKGAPAAMPADGKITCAAGADRSDDT
jgi:hypothetical protein